MWPARKSPQPTRKSPGGSSGSLPSSRSRFGSISSSFSGSLSPERTIRRPRGASIFRQSTSLLSSGSDHHAALVAPLMRRMSEVERTWEEGRSIGTFPALLTILEMMWGVVMFLKFGWAISHAGLPLALLAVLVSVVTQLLSASSLSALATNDMRYTGPLSMLSHNLGGGVGITVGSLYFLGLSALAGVEIAGSVEVLDDWLRGADGQRDALLSSEYADQLVLSTCALLLLGLVRAYYPPLVHLASYVVLATVFVAILACTAGLCLAGLSLDKLRANVATSASASWSDFGEVLVFVYPCFLGLFGAANKAKQLLRPTVSIPRATLAAPLLSGVLYAFMMLVLAAGATPDELGASETHYLALAWPHPAVGYVGAMVIGVGSCLTCVDVAPWMLFAISQEARLPWLRTLGLDQLTGGEPVRAVVVTLLLSLPFLCAPELGTIATCAAISFLAMYGTMNTACFVMSAAQLPSWRPVFDTHGWRLSLLGMLISLCVQLTLSPLVAGLIIGLSVAAILLIEQSAVAVEYNSHVAIKGVKYKMAHALLLSFDRREDAGQYDSTDCDADYWRPQVLCYLDSQGSGLSGQEPSTAVPGARRSESDWAHRSRELLRFVSQLKGSGGLAMVSSTVCSANAVLKVLAAAPSPPKRSRQPSAGVSSRRGSQPQLPPISSLSAAECAALADAAGAGAAPPLSPCIEEGSERANSEASVVPPRASSDGTIEPLVPSAAVPLSTASSSSSLLGGACSGARRLAPPPAGAGDACDVSELTELTSSRECVSQFDEMLEVMRRDADLKARLEERIWCLMDEAKLLGFCSVVFSHSPTHADSMLLQLSGIGGLRPNTVTLLWPEEAPLGTPADERRARAERFLAFLVSCSVHNKAIICLKLEQGASMEPPPSLLLAHTNVIDLWWVVHDAGLLVLLAHLLLKNVAWVHCRLRVFTICLSAAERERVKRNLEGYLTRIHRIDVAEVHVLVLEPGLSRRPSGSTEPGGGEGAADSPFHALVLEHSASSALVIMNLPQPGRSAALEPEAYIESVSRLTDGLTRCMLVHGSGNQGLTEQIKGAEKLTSAIDAVEQRAAVRRQSVIATEQVQRAHVRRQSLMAANAAVAAGCARPPSLAAMPPL